MDDQNFIQTYGADVTGKSTYGNGKFLVANDRCVQISSDAENWRAGVDVFNVSPNVAPYTIAYGKGRFIISGYEGKIGSSEDGETWTARTSWTTKAWRGT